ncbi:MAG TPA: PVC-type heme-binding CxxCH protein [Gemmataceae bacterium]|nr:PVC-type heme-binding CxxCH protein [Gemmataceae bacterium]
MSWPCRSVFAAALLWIPSPLLAQSEYGFVNTRPSGQPYLTPEESLKRLHVPPGFEVKLFAAEPDIINPISFTVDERGRLWVVECYEYPKRTPKGQKPRDRIKILEDTTGDGKADKVTLWAEGKDLPTFDLASGIEVGHGGVFLGAAPYLFFLQDRTGAGRCDHCEILLKGFGSQDTHETLNTFQWGPDGRLYGLHGIFTQSQIGETRLNAAVWRYGTKDRKFEIFAEGTSNPWGLDFDAHGQAFLTACVIGHCFHIVPGGTYVRQAGSSANPYAFGLLPEISDHKHHQESGWAHAGALVLQGESIPAEYQNSLLMGSIHGCSIKRDLLERRGSTFVARHAPDFLTSGDKNFRPINLRWGPDGSIYVIDWHDQNPCHQAQPDSWDMTHGRIYKIQRTGTRSIPPLDLSRKTTSELVELLKNNNPWWHRTALRLLADRRDRSVAPMLEALLFQSNEEPVNLRGLWGLHAVGAFDERVADKALGHPSPWVRSWAVRFVGEAGAISAGMTEKLARLAEREQAPEVRLQLASTAHRLPGPTAIPLLHHLMHHASDVRDPFIPLMIWLAYEPYVAKQPDAEMAWLKDHAAANPLVAEEIVSRTLRRLAGTGKPAALAASVAFLGDVTDSTVRRRAMEGLIQALQNRQVDPPVAWKRVFAVLLQDSDSEVQRLAHRLAVNFRDLEAVRRSLAAAQDGQKPVSERIDAIRVLGIVHPAEALRPLQNLLLQDPDANLRGEVCRALAAYDQPEVARTVLAGWKQYPPGVRVEAINLLSGRKEWARQLLAAVGNHEVARTDLNDNTILRLRALRDQKLNGQIEAVWGKVRETTPAELEALIGRMRISLSEGRGSFERGRTVFENQCAKCHRFEGKGHDVGPNLDGAARDIDYLLVNILDPNRIVGQPYFTRFVVLKNGQVETGLLTAEDPQSITLKTENDALKVIQRKDIDELTVRERSLMPEGLNDNLSPQDFRDLIRYLMVNPFLTEVAVAPTGAVALNLADPLHSDKVTWSWPIVGPPGRIPLPPPPGQGDGIACVAAEVTAPTVMHTQLLFGAAHPVRIWLNGKSVYQGTPGKSPAEPDQRAIPLELAEGLNRFIFEFRYQAAGEGLYARLLDPQRRLHYPEKHQ